MVELLLKSYFPEVLCLSVELQNNVNDIKVWETYIYFKIRYFQTLKLH